MPGQNSRAFIYLRISQDRSGAGLGVSRQREQCESLAERLGLEVLEVFTDNDASAYSGKLRPAYLAMTDRFNEVGHVIVWHADRLYRRPQELEAYIRLSEEHSVWTHAATGSTLDMATSSGRFEARLYTVIAARESEHKSDRSRLRAKQTLAQGRHVGGPRPFGWDLAPRTETERSQKLGNRYVVNERESTAISDAADELLGGRSIGSILREWSDPKRSDGPLLTTQGNQWSHASFRKMMQRPRNCGIITSDGEEIARDLYEAPLEYHTWRAVLRLFNSRSAPRGHANKARRLAVGIATCPCGRPVKTSGVSGQGVDPETGKRPYYWTYFCKTPGTGHVSKRVPFVDDVVRLAVSDLFWQPMASKDALSPEEVERQSQLLRDIRDLEHRYDGAVEAFATGTLTPRMLGKVEHEIATRRVTLDEELTALETKSRTFRPAGDPFGVKRHTELMTDWLTWHLDDQRDFVRSHLQIELLPTPKGARRVFDPHSVRVTVLGDPADIEDDGTEDQLIYPGARVGPYWRYYEGKGLIGERVSQFQRDLGRLRQMESMAGLP